MPELTNLSTRVSNVVFSELIPQFNAQGINFVRDKVSDVYFTFELSVTPSLRELIGAFSQVDRAIRVAAGLTAYNNRQLEVWSGANPRDSEELEIRLQGDSEAWDLEIDELGLGSVRLNLKPKGESIKKVAAKGFTAATLLASVSQFTGVTGAGVAHDVMGGKATHSIVQVNDAPINVSQPREEDIIIRLPSGSTLTGIIDLGPNKHIVLKIEAESESATLSG